MNPNDNTAEASIALEAAPERGLIRLSGSFRHMDFALRVDQVVAQRQSERLPLNLALVIDRSGSMDGEKLAMAKRVASAVLDQVDDRDRVALVCFDDRIDVLREGAQATTAIKASIRRALDDVAARGSTNLHEGWLTGCQTIAPEGSFAANSVGRCFLLTDGLANVGLTDPEQIASQAAEIRERAGIITSTFGIGPDYDEHLLGPMAVGGSGQFHNLRTVQDIRSTFLGELNAALAVAVRDARLEIQTEGVAGDVVSQFWTERRPDGTTTVAVGDMMAGEERHVVVRFGFPASRVAASGTYAAGGQSVRYRLVYRDATGQELAGPWLETAFRYAEHQACDAEGMNPIVMHWVGLAHADRARREATARNRAGDNRGARQLLKVVAKRMEAYAGTDTDLRAAIEELKALDRDLKDRPADTLLMKEVLFEAQSRSRGQRDYR